jgi:hypothetical protein
MARRASPRTSEGECACSGPPDRLGLDAHPTGERSSRRGRLVDYGAALEMRFGATRRGFESRPLRHSTRAERTPGRALAAPVLAYAPRGARAPVLPAAFVRTPARCADAMTQSDAEHPRTGVSSHCRARRGTSGALNLQSAPAGLNSHPRSPYSNATVSSDVEDRVPRSGDSRTVSGPEGSSTKRISSGAAERPGPSRSSRRARDHGGRRWVHGISSSPTPGS